MSNWFDGLAKRAARGEVEDAGSGSGPTRRQVLVGTAAVTGAMWTAPMLMSAAAALNAASCPPDSPFSMCPDNAAGITGLCCPDLPLPQSCGINGVGTVGCVPDDTVGGQCSNSGEGQCGGKVGYPARARCNGKTDPNICGGQDAGCGGNQGEICAPGFSCLPPPPGVNPPAGQPGTCQPTLP